MGRRARGRAGGATPAVVQLQQAGIAFTEHPYEHDPAAPSYGLEAAEALGVPPAQVFKTLVVALDSGLGVAVLPVDQQLDLKAAGSALGVKKAALADAAVAQRASGYVVGGISPVGWRTPAPTVLDDSALAFPVIYVSGGRRGFDVGLAPADLVSLLSATTAALTRKES